MTEYKYLIQGNTGDGWFDIMSFMASMPLEDYIKEQRDMHPGWDVRVVENPKYKRRCPYCKNVIPSNYTMKDHIFVCKCVDESARNFNRIY